MKTRRTSLLSHLTPILLALAASVVLFLSLGLWILFAAVWGCQPEHHADHAACPSTQVPFAIAQVAAICLAPLVIAAWWIRRSVRRASG